MDWHSVPATHNHGNISYMEEHAYINHMIPVYMCNDVVWCASSSVVLVVEK